MRMMAGLLAVPPVAKVRALARVATGVTDEPLLLSLPVVET